MSINVRTNSVKHFGKRTDFGAMRIWRNGSGDVWVSSGLKLKKSPRMLTMCGMHNRSKSLLVLNTLTNSNFTDLHLRTCSCYVGISEQISPNHTVLHLFAKYSLLTKEQQYAEDVVTLFCLIFLFMIAEWYAELPARALECELPVVQKRNNRMISRGMKKLTYWWLTVLTKIHFHVHPLKCCASFHVNAAPISIEFFRMKVRQLRLRIWILRAKGASQWRQTGSPTL